MVGYSSERDRKRDGNGDVRKRLSDGDGSPQRG